MACYRPLDCFQTSDGSIVFSEVRRHDVVRSLSLPCGQCVGCKLERTRQWAVRVLHEASLSEQNSFITLTYANEHLPDRGQLDYPQFQLFMKRLRRRISPIKPRFFMCGEYGEVDSRPHYHACVFGFDFHADLEKGWTKKEWKKSANGSLLYRSSLLEELWPLGHSSVGELNFQTASYVARYCVKKVTGRGAAEHYLRVDPDTGELYSMVPEFTHMSLKPGIGKEWYTKFASDVFPHDHVVVNGRAGRVPKYYDRQLEKEDPDLAEAIFWDRQLRAVAHRADNTPERLVVREVVARAGLSLLKRSSF